MNLMGMMGGGERERGGGQRWRKRQGKRKIKREQSEKFLDLGTDTHVTGRRHMSAVVFACRFEGLRNG